MWGRRGGSIAGIFIGYRRDDAQGSAGRIYDRLTDHYGKGRVFRDVDTIRTGVDFVQRVQEAIDASDVTLVVMGPDWTSLTDADGKRRLDDPGDYVRLEVEMAMAQPDHVVMPVLVDGAPMPSPGELPESIRPMAFLQTAEIRIARFDDDVDHLIGEIGGRPRVAKWLKSHPLPSLAVTGGLVAAAILVVGTLIGGGLSPLLGDFNVAVAQFGTTNQADDATARGIADAAHRSISQKLFEFEQAGDFENLAVADPATIGRIDGSTLEARTREAGDLAEKINADVVLFGNLDAGSGVSVFSAELYLSDRNLRNAEELAGAYSFGLIELPTTDPVAVTREVSAVLESQAEAVAELVVGLSYYALSDYEIAREHFLDAEAAWQGNETGKEVVFHLLGNATGHLAADRPSDAQTYLAEARDYYSRALAIDPTYARSHFGLAEVQFQENKGPACGPGTEPADPGALGQAADQFRNVTGMDAPPLSFLPARAELEIGRIYLCLNQYGENLLEEARVQFESVIAENSSNDRLRNLVADAHQSLAAYHFANGDPQAAVDEYRIAIEVSLEAGKRARFHAAIGFIYECVLADPDAADAAYARSAEERAADDQDPLPRARCESS